MAIYADIYNGPANNSTPTGEKKRYIAIHNTSNDASASGEASYAKRRTDGVSSHYYVDDKQIIQSLDTSRKAWHAGSSTGNTYAISYEITGTNGKSRSWWMANVAWDLLAKQIARDMKRWGIKNKRLSVSEMKDGKSSGIVTHNDMRLAWGGTTHTDPGPNFPMDYLVQKVNEYLDGDGDMLADERQMLKDVHWALFKADAPGRPEGSIAWKVETIKLALDELKAKDLVNEQEVANLVIQGLSGKTIEEMAEALRVILGEEKTEALKNVL